MERPNTEGIYEWLSSAQVFRDSGANYSADGAYSPRGINLEIVKPPSDDRNYRVISLPNRLQVLLISDQYALRSAVALSVQTGSALDPKELPGLAHLCQHMVMAGSSVREDDKSFEEFLESHNGVFSATTQKETTTFAFELPSSNIRPALECFGQFISSPSFPQSRLADTIEKIQLDFESRAENEEVRRSQVIATIAQRNHPIRQFDCGNSQTLWGNPVQQGINVLNQVKQFYSRFYSANLMNLVVIGHDSLDDLESHVRCLFSGLRNSNVERFVYTESPFRPGELPSCIEMVPQRSEIRSLLLMFPIPDCTNFYKTGTIPYIRYILSYEGPGSLISGLKASHWIKSAEVHYEQPLSGVAFITVEFQLTSEGILRTTEIIQNFFQWVKLHRKYGPVESTWEELRIVNETKFLFMPRESPLTHVETLVTLMPCVPMSEILSCRYLFTEYNAPLIQGIMDCIVPTRMLICTTWRGFHSTADLVEHWYGTRYRCVPTEEALVRKWTHGHRAARMSLPPPNPFIATDFTLKFEDENDGDGAPLKIQEDEFSRIWYLRDGKFQEPRATIVLHIHSVVASESALEQCLTQLMARVVGSFLAEFTSSASEAGLSFSIEPSIHGLTITVHGYNHKLHLLFNYVLNRLFHFLSYENVGPNFEFIKRDYTEELEESLDNQVPYQVALEYVDQFTSNELWTRRELLQAMQAGDVTSFELVSFAQRFFSSVKLDWLFHGNYTKKEALKIYETSMEYFHCVNCKPLKLPPKLKIAQKILLPSGLTIVERTHGKEGSAAAQVIFCSLQPPSTRQTVLLEMMEQLLSNAASEVLAGKDSMIWTEVRRTSETLALLILVQAVEEDDPRAIQQDVTRIIASMAAVLKSLSRKDFLNLRLTLGVHKADSQPRSLWEASNQIFREILHDTYKFQRTQKEMLEIQDVTQAELWKFYDEWIRPESSNRRCLCVNVTGSQSSAKREQTNENPTDERWHHQTKTSWAAQLQGSGLDTPEQGKKGDSKLKTVKDSDYLVWENATRRGPLTSLVRKHSAGSTQSSVPPSNSSRLHHHKPTSKGKSSLTVTARSEGDSSAHSDYVSSSDADCQTIQKYYHEVEQEIEILNEFKRFLLNEIQKTKPPSPEPNDASLTMENALHTFVEPGATGDDEKTQQSEPLKLRVGAEHPEMEYKVYALTSIQRDNEKDRGSRTSRRSSARTRPVDSILLKDDITTHVLPESLKPGGKYYNTLQPTLSRLLRRIDRNKVPDKDNTEAAGREPRKKSDAKLVKRKSNTSRSSEKRKVGSKSRVATQSGATLKSKKIFPELSEEERVAEIEELDYDIQQEILRLQKLRKLLDAKARRILEKEQELAAQESRNRSEEEKNNAESPGQSTLSSKEDTIRQTRLDAKLARKVEKTVQRAKNKYADEAAAETQRIPNEELSRLEELEQKIAKLEKEEGKATKVFKTFQDVQVIEQAGASRASTASTQAGRPLTSASSPKAKDDRFGPSKRDSTDGSFRHQDLIQWLQGMFSKNESTGVQDRAEDTKTEVKEQSRSNGIAEATETGVQVQVEILEANKRASPASGIRPASKDTANMENNLPRIEIDRLPTITESELKTGPSPPEKISSPPAASKPKVMMKPIKPAPKASSPSVSANSSTVKPRNTSPAKPQQIITQHGITPKLPLKSQQSTKPSFNLSTRLNHVQPADKASKISKKSIKKLEKASKNSFPLKPIRKRSESNTLSPMKRHEKRKQEVEESTKLDTNAVGGHDLSAKLNFIAPSTPFEPSVLTEVKKTLSDAELEKLRHMNVLTVRATSSERDMPSGGPVITTVEEKEGKVLRRRLSFIGTETSELDLKPIRTSPPRRSSRDTVKRQRSRSRRSSSTVRTLARRRSSKDVGRSRRKGNKSTRKDVSSSHKATKETKKSVRKSPHKEFRTTTDDSSDDDVTTDKSRTTAEEGDNIAEDINSLKSITGSKRSSKAHKKSRGVKKFRRHSSRESLISAGYNNESPPSPVVGLGRELGRLRASGYDVLTAAKHKEQTWETLRVKEKELADTLAGPLSDREKRAELELERSHIMSKVAEWKHHNVNKTENEVEGGQQFKANISQQVITDLKQMNRNIRISPVKQMFNSTVRKAAEY